MKHAQPAKTALLIIDCINDLDFPGAENLLPWAEALVKPLLSFRRQAHAANIPVIYVNDNFKAWHASFEEILRYCSRPRSLGKNLSTRLRPGKKDYQLIKPRHSAFFYTSLIPLLEDLDINHLILSGIATNLCVLFTAHDAHMHRYKLTILSDCCAAQSDFDHETALSQLKSFCGARICKSCEFKFPKKRKS